MKPLSGAIIGFGNIAQWGHWPTYARSDKASIVAVAEPSAARRTVAHALKPSLRLYESPEELFESERLDFVDICTPPSSHTQLALLAIERGIDVLCEKPLCLQRSDYISLIQSRYRNRSLVFPVHNWKYAPAISKVFEMIRQGRIGDVEHVEIATLRSQVCPGTSQGAIPGCTRSEDWRTDPSIAGGGITIDHGWHAFYLLLNLVGQQPEKLQALMEGPEGGLEETAHIVVQFPKAEAHINLTWRSDLRRNTLKIRGSEASILLDDERLSLEGAKVEKETYLFPPLSGDSHHPQWFGSLFDAFLAERHHGGKNGAALDEAGWCLALTEAAYASGFNGSGMVPVIFPNCGHGSDI